MSRSNSPEGSSTPGSPQLYADEELSSSEEDEPPLQEQKVTSSTSFYSGNKRDVPLMRDNCFTYIFPPDQHGIFGTMFIESSEPFSLSEYNFGALFLDYGDVSLEFNLALFDLFEAMLDYKWQESNLEYTTNVYSHRDIAICTFPNIDYWPPILAWFARQCMHNNIGFFNYVKLLDHENNDYGTVFA